MQDLEPKEAKKSFFSKVPKEKKVPKPKKEKKEKPQNTAFGVDKPEEHIAVSALRKRGLHLFLRAVIWTLLIGLCAKGIYDITQPNPITQIQNEAKIVMEKSAAEKSVQIQVSGFAGNFAQEYMSYETGKEEDYATRLKAYNPKLFSATASTGLVGIASCGYAQPYKVEAYTENQYDVYLLCKVNYVTLVPSPDGTTVAQTSVKKDTYLKVPVRWSADGGCVIENYPSFVAGPVAKEPPNESLAGDKIENVELDALSINLTDFFKSYFSQDQSLLDFFLTAEGRKTVFALNGRYQLDRIDKITAYKDPEVAGDVIVVAKLTIKDVNNVIFPQQYSLKMTKQDSKYYIKSIGTRIADLNFKTQEE